MKLTLMLLQSIDGYIAEDLNDNLSWGSSEDKKFFKEITTAIGTMIMGSKTYESMPEAAFKNREALVFTHDPNKFEQKENIIFFEGTAKDAVNQLQLLGKTEAVIAGGGSIYSSFLSEDLVDELYITVAPIVLGGGIKAFTTDKIRKFQLVKVLKLNENEVVLHYIK